MSSNFAPRSVAWIAVVALAAGWTGKSLTTPEPPAQAERPSGPRPLGSNVPMPQAERLHDRATVAPLPSRGRNPFVYGARSAARPSGSSRDTAMMAAPAPAPAPVVTEPPTPVLRLTGIASSLEDGMAALTAIVTVNGAMSFVKPGAQLTGGYTVLRVDETSVVLVDASGVTQTLRLP